eukprot:TRINITY_DN32766_c0_g1_i1.p1 TRINITY_DN32766_c0_g1~~TRINITY_DN32766_c0_g1_i1.p1  ORF type:complete len:919 (+),score=162.32 TRINITY_DN32766_c0_g1_i1:545-3301(+)
MRMKDRNALVTRLTVVDNLAATSVICTDKTGTLTEGKMTAQTLVGVLRERSNAVSESRLAFYPLRGASPNGGLFLEAALTPQAKAVMDKKCDPGARRQTFAEPGLQDLAEVSDDYKTKDAALARAHLACACLASSRSAALQFDGSKTAWTTAGNMTDAALRVAAAKGGYFSDAEITKKLEAACERVPDLEIPFSSKRKLAVTVYTAPAGRLVGSLALPQEATHFAIVVGAPDKLIAKCGAVPSWEDARLQLPGAAMSAQERSTLEQRNVDMASSALRGLLVGVRALSAAAMKGLQRASTADARLAMLLDPPSDEPGPDSHGLCFLTMWGIADAPRATVPDSIVECHKAGIRVVMITGDQQLTAQSVAQNVHILDRTDDPLEKVATCAALYADQQFRRTPSQRLSARASEILRSTSGGSIVGSDSPQELPALSQEAEKTLAEEPTYKSREQLVKLTSRINVWARAQPSDKVAIVESLAGQGFMTAMTGDGVNDAPALKRASVGVSMGIVGSEVAKSTSDLILMDDDFSTIVAAIKEGRRLYMNTQKYVLANLSLKAGECVTILSAIGMGFPLPLRPLQQVVNLVVTHIVATLPFAFEPEESYTMSVPPRDTTADLVVPPFMWLWRWCPFVICFGSTMLVSVATSVYAHTGFIRHDALVGSSRVGLVDSGLVACEYAGRLEHGVFYRDDFPFHCKCLVHPGGLLWNAPEEVDQWGSSGPDAALAEDQFDKWTGMPLQNQFDLKNTQWAKGRDRLLKPCGADDGIMHWCWTGSVTDKDRLFLPKHQNCAAAGMHIGQSMAYATLQFGEMMSIFTYRMDDFFITKATTNPVFLRVFLANIGALLAFLYAPSARWMMSLSPLTVPRLLCAMAFGLLLTAQLEVVKFFYRRQLYIRNAQLEKEAIFRSTGKPLRVGSGEPGSSV